jgi:hypothetical protein
MARIVSGVFARHRQGVAYGVDRQSRNREPPEPVAPPPRLAVEGLPTIAGAQPRDRLLPDFGRHPDHDRRHEFALGNTTREIAS